MSPVTPRPPPRISGRAPFHHQRSFLGRRPMQTIRRAAAVLMYPVIMFLSVACDRAADRTPTSPPVAPPRADLLGATTQDATAWLARALSLGELLSDDPRMTAWT